ncbi:MAG: CPBP family intramembrane metalloprotease, partial [Roseburia sp.]|nr:CPBP family intramembrane metalloprotease [Roseburia sp.]
MIKTSPFFEGAESRAPALKETAYKYGIAMVVLVLNNVAAPILFSLLFALSGLRPEEGSDGYYAAVMLLNELSAYTFPILILRRLFARERAAFTPDLGYGRFPGDSLALFLGGVAAGSLGSIATELIGEALDRLFGTGEIPEAFGDMKPQSPAQLGVFMFCICVIAPLAEEYLFRDLLLKPLRLYHDLAAVLFGGLTFGLYHGNFDQFAYAALLGGFYSVAAVRANSIRPTVLFHAANNLVVCLASYLPAAVPEAADLAAAFSAVLNVALPIGAVAALL